MDHPAVTPVAPSPDWLDLPGPAPLPPAAPQPHPTSSPVRRFVSALVVFFCLFLVVRTVGLEPFGVPTGSMAPTLFGNHREADCTRCGYRVVVGEPGPDARPVRFDAARCPNCGATCDLTSAREVPGDRLMVDKTAFQARPPRRWEVAVFHCPADLSKPYVKRIVGLPGEVIEILGGDVYADGELLRKTLAQVRETWLPVFDLNYPPPGGWAARWVAEPVADPNPPAATSRKPDRTVDGTVLRDNALYLDGTAGAVGLTYRHWNLDAKKEEAVGDHLGYNGGPEKFAHGRSDPVHDLALVFDLEVIGGSGAFALRLGDGVDTVRADIRIGEVPASTSVTRDGTGESTDNAVTLRPGKTYRVEFAFVDRRASLAIDGRQLPPLDLPARPTHRPVTRPAQLGVRGASVAVKNLRIMRDIHYLPAGKAGRWRLGPAEYFALGDNTANSHDSRAWTIDERPAPGVPAGAFIGKPFLIHQPLRLGRVTMNGRDRVYQTLDWSRMRWLR